MSARTRRRRALLLLCLSLACGGLAASQVRGRVAEVESRAGALVPVLAVRGDLPADTELSPGRLELRRVPERFAPADSLARPEDAAGLRTAAPLAAGAYVTAGVVQGAGEEGGGGPGLRRGERALELPVAGGGALEGAGPGTRVDVLVSVESRAGGGRTFMALEAVELLDLRPGAEGAGEEGRATATATLRVTARQAVYLTAAAGFAREVRLLPRPPGDRGRVGRAEVPSGGL